MIVIENKFPQKKANSSEKGGRKASDLRCYELRWLGYLEKMMGDG